MAECVFVSSSERVCGVCVLPFVSLSLLIEIQECQFFFSVIVMKEDRAAPGKVTELHIFLFLCLDGLCILNLII